jgi:uncharacterized membrane protein YjgN (DUF898 family)
MRASEERPVLPSNRIPARDSFPQFFTQRRFNMAIVDDVHAAGKGVPNPLLPVRLGFSGRTRDYWRLMLRGAALQVITLGLYRFWLYTDMRRFLWASTRVADDTPEYEGTAAELLIGFLIALGILVPIYAVISVGAIVSGVMTPQQFSIIGFVALVGLGEYAAYRARGYRLTRTVFRGLRFHQTGSAIGYAARATLWWALVALTLGLAWPWAMASLERYKMRNTFYGRLGGGFAGSGTRLFRQGVVIWLLTVGPLAAGLAAGETLIGWSAVVDVLKDPDAMKDWQIFAMDVAVAALKDDTTKLGAKLLLGGIAASTLAVALLYPLYQATVTRWWLGGLRFGGAAAASALRVSRYYAVYARYVLNLALFTIAFLAVAYGLILAAGSMLGVPPSQIEDGFGDVSTLAGVVTTGAGIAGWVIYLLGASTIYHAVLRMRLWKAAVESTRITGRSTLDHVRADEARSTAIGEGLADALGGGSGI